jgi:hypothetical protein
MDKKILADYRLSDNPKYFNGYESELMTIPDEIRDCVAFIGCNLKGTGEFVLGGTTFFVRMNVFDEIVPALYAITARHVIEDAREASIDQRIFLQVNDCKQGTRRISTSYSDWFLHPWDATADVAVFPMRNLDWDFDQKFFPYDRFAFGDTLMRAKIRLGEEIFMTGLFYFHAGAKQNASTGDMMFGATTRNIPIVRVGNIATMMEQKIRSKGSNGDDIDVDGYLVETRSLGGISGSPVFAVLDEGSPSSQQLSWSAPPLSYASGDQAESNVRVDPVTSIKRQFCLMGLLHGHYDVPASPPYISYGKIKRDLNLGVAIVVPASKIIEVLFHPTVEAERAKMFRERRESNSPVTLDSRFND